jgi:hypothetical protein
MLVVIGAASQAITLVVDLLVALRVTRAAR